MKKIKSNSATLQLNKERIMSLTNYELQFIQGGGNVDQCTVTRNPPPPDLATKTSTMPCIHKALHTTK